MAIGSVSQAGLDVRVSVDGYTETIRSTRPDVGRLLTDLGLQLRAEDRVKPSLDTELAPGVSISVERARRGLVVVDGDVREVYSGGATVGEMLEVAGVIMNPYDEVWVDGRLMGTDALLPAPVRNMDAPRFERGRPWVGQEAQAVRLQVNRAVRITVDDGHVPYAIFTTAQTVGEALLREQITLYLGDEVRPALGSRVQAGTLITIARSKPVVVTFDGRTVRTRTRGKTVGDALTELGINVTGSDRVTPAMSEALLDNTAIKIVRVVETMLVERESIPYEAILVPDDNLEIDHQQLTQAGQEGEFRRRIRVVYEDGAEISRAEVDAWVATPPVTQVTSYGRKLVSRQLETTGGTVTYWRKVRMLATSYSPSTSGVPASSPYFGRTRTGTRVTKGIVAVDPTLIPLGSRVYVPGYGVGLAADTGGAVRAMHIDLGFEDGNLEMWYRWVDVYLLDPPPALSRIRWILPNWPKPK